MSAPPLAYQWTGETMAPVGRFAAEADRHFVIGERYVLVEHEHRSAASHRHFFACVNEAWANLPEHMAERLPTPDHLRKYALIKAGFRDVRSISCASRAEALRIAGFIRPMDEFAVVKAEGAVVFVATAQSQNMRAMGRERFQQSKEAVLGVLAEMIGVQPPALLANAARAA